MAWQDDTCRTNRFLRPNTCKPPLTISLRKFYYQACDIINGLRRVFFPQLPCRHAKVLTGSFRAPAEKTILVTMLYYIFLDLVYSRLRIQYVPQTVRGDYGNKFEQDDNSIIADTDHDEALDGDTGEGGDQNRE